MKEEEIKKAEIVKREEIATEKKKKEDEREKVRVEKEEKTRKEEEKKKADEILRAACNTAGSDEGVVGERRGYLSKWNLIGMMPAIASMPSRGDVLKAPRIQMDALLCILLRTFM